MKQANRRNPCGKNNTVVGFVIIETAVRQLIGTEKEFFFFGIINRNREESFQMFDEIISPYFKGTLQQLTVGDDGIVVLRDSKIRTGSFQIRYQFLPVVQNDIGSHHISSVVKADRKLFCRCLRRKKLKAAAHVTAVGLYLIETVGNHTCHILADGKEADGLQLG